MGFYVQDDFWEALEEMPASVQNEVFGALTRTFFTGDTDAEMKSLKGASKAVYIALRDRVLLARKKSAAGGSKRGSKRDQNADQNVDQTSDQNAIKTEGALLKSESESENKNKRENTLVGTDVPPKVSGGRFSPPSPAQVEAYAKSRGQTIDGERFCDYYASKGWKVGKSPMKDWQSAVRNWLRRDEGVSLDAEGQRYASLV